jgi:hypothetical protein
MDAPITQEGINIVCETHGKMMGVCNTDEKFLQRFIELWPRRDERNAFFEKVMASWMTKGILDIPLTVEGCKGTSYSPKDGAKQILKIWEGLPFAAGLECYQNHWYIISKKVSAAVMMGAEDDEPIKDAYDLELERDMRRRKENE